MVIDNFDSVLNFLEFGDDYFYIMYVHRRPKDYGITEYKAFPYSLDEVFSFFIIKDKNDALKFKEDAILSAKKNGGRVYITIYPIPIEKIKKIQDVSNDLVGIIDKEALKEICISEPIFGSYTLADVDGEYTDKIKEVALYIKYLMEYTGKEKFLVVNTKNGYHILSQKISIKKLEERFPFLWAASHASVMLYYSDEQE